MESVRDRLRRAAAALDAAGVPYAIAGGNAVAAWVATIDEGAVRNTQDVDILRRREDLGRAAAALATMGFIHQEAAGVGLFLDGPDATPRHAVRVVMANEKVRPHYEAPAPDVTDAMRQGEPSVLIVGLESLVRMKLTSCRRKDQLHLLDMLEVGLIDATWPARFAPPLAARLQQLIDNPEA